MTAFGDALLRAWGGAGRSRSYEAKGWHAQITKLTESQRGYDAMAAAGISITPETLIKWLTRDNRDTDFSPTASNQAKIRNAYEIMAGRWRTANETRDYRIRGVVKIGEDERDRGADRTSPLLVHGTGGDWGRIRDAWNAGTLTPEDAEDWFVEDIIGNDDALADTSDTWEFPGTSYTIT